MTVKLVYIFKVWGLSKYYVVFPVILIKICKCPCACNSKVGLLVTLTPYQCKHGFNTWPRKPLWLLTAHSQTTIKKAKLIQLTQATEQAFSQMSWSIGKDAGSYSCSSLDVLGCLEIDQCLWVVALSTGVYGDMARQCHQGSVCLCNRNTHRRGCLTRPC